MTGESIRENIMKLQYGFLWLIVLISIVLFVFTLYRVFKIVKKENTKNKLKKAKNKSINWITTIDTKILNTVKSRPGFLNMFLFATIGCVSWIVIALISPTVLRFFTSVPNEINVFEVSKFTFIMYCVVLLISWNSLKKSSSNMNKNKNKQNSLFEYTYIFIFILMYTFVQYVDLVKNVFIPFPYIISKWNPVRFFYFDFFVNIYRLNIGKLIHLIFQLFRLPDNFFITIICYLISIIIIVLIYFGLLQVIKGNKQALSIFCKRSTDSIDKQCVRTLKREIYHVSIVTACGFLFYNIIWKQLY